MSADTYVITGANRGIGLALAKEAASRGHRVIATTRDPERSNELVAAASASRGHIEVRPLEVTGAASAEAFARDLGERPVDVLINNAGIYGRGAFATSMPEQSFESMDFDLWSTVLATNLLAPFRITQLLLPHLLRSSRPRVVMMSSDLGSIGNNKMGQSHAYRTSKAALNMVTRGLARDLQAKGVSVVSMAPGWCRTDLGGPQAPLDPADSARGQIAIFEKLTAAESGTFVNFRGEPVPW